MFATDYSNKDQVIPISNRQTQWEKWGRGGPPGGGGCGLRVRLGCGKDWGWRGRVMMETVEAMGEAD